MGILKKGKPKDTRAASFWDMRFKEAVVVKNPYVNRWRDYEAAYAGDYFSDVAKPEYRANEVSNYIFSVVETIRPIMVDNNPQFQALPRLPMGVPGTELVQKALSYEWEREGMNLKLYRGLVDFLVTGNMFFFQPWDSAAKQATIIPVSPYNIFVDPMATSIEDAEYIMYAKYMHENKVKKMFPEHAEKLIGSSVKYEELVTEDNREQISHANQILVIEVWCRDWTTIDYEEDNGDGTKTKVKKMKYPKGRRLIVAPELDLTLDDVKNPYKDGEFPFTHIKCYDLPMKFWGEGEVKQLISPQKALNDLNNQILDNAKATANMPWIVDNNSGIGRKVLSNRPGLIIRKNPGSEVRRDAPPNMPVYIKDKGLEFKEDMEQISGIFDTMKGNSEKGVYTAQGILALQEAGQARVRLKVKILEEGLARMAKIQYSRMRQFWKGTRLVRIVGEDGSVGFQPIDEEALLHDYDIKVTSGSTMPINRSAMLDLMIRLATTPAEDGKPMVDRQAVLQYLPAGEKEEVLKRMNGQGENFQMMVQQMQQQMMTTMETLEQVVGAIEKIGGEIGQVKQEHAKIKEEEKLTQMKDESYNNGYADAEKMYQVDENTLPPSIGEGAEAPLDESTPMDAPSPTEGLGEEQGIEAIPPELLAQIDQMSDEELAELLNQFPQLADIIKSLGQA